jgi:hypothetical protein
MLVYQCQEYAEFIDSNTGKDLSSEEVFEAFINSK